MRIVAFCFLWIVLSASAATAQQDTAVAVRHHFQRADSVQNSTARMMDSVAHAMAARQQFVEDSVAMFYIGSSDSARSVAYTKLLLKESLYTGNGFLDLHLKSKAQVREGSSRHMRDSWVLGIVLILLIYTGFLNLFMGKSIQTVFRSFYGKRILSQVSNEDTLLNSWAFLGLFLLFGLTAGLFAYQITASYNRFYSVSGFQLFAYLAVLIMALFIVKYLVLKFMGFVFDISKAVSDYISILHLTYFNITFVFLPLTVCFCLILPRYFSIVITVAEVLAVVIFIWQYLRSSINIISNFRFHKFYLFIYLCALEICPVLVLIKALNV